MAKNDATTKRPTHTITSSMWVDGTNAEPFTQLERAATVVLDSLFTQLNNSDGWPEDGDFTVTVSWERRG